MVLEILKTVKFVLCLTAILVIDKRIKRPEYLKIMRRVNGMLPKYWTGDRMMENPHKVHCTQSQLARVRHYLWQGWLTDKTIEVDIGRFGF